MHVTVPPGPRPSAGTDSHVIPLSILSSSIVTVPASVTVPLLLTVYVYSISSPTPAKLSTDAVFSSVNSRFCATVVLWLACSSPASSAPAVTVLSTSPASTSACVTS